MKKFYFISMVFWVFFLFTTTIDAEEIIIFTGIPTIKISEGGMERLPENLSKNKSINYKCTITEIDKKYYWTTRENIELIPVQSGVYITFWAVTGAGYIRIIKPKMKKISYSLLDETEKKFDYVEHLLLGLKSVTYYGELKNKIKSNDSYIFHQGKKH